MARRPTHRVPIQQLTTDNQLKRRNAKQRNPLHTLFPVETAKSILADNLQHNNLYPHPNVNLLLATDLTYQHIAGVGLEHLTTTRDPCLTEGIAATLGSGRTEKVIEYQRTIGIVLPRFALGVANQTFVV